MKYFCTGARHSLNVRAYACRARATMFTKMSVSERVQIAKEKTRRVVDHLHYLLELHENNAIVLYTPTLSQLQGFGLKAIRRMTEIATYPAPCWCTESELRI
jgi:hypothetical protein